jgi:hypothetical protein
MVGPWPVDTYEKGKLMDALAAECTELHGKVLFKM